MRTDDHGSARQTVERFRRVRKGGWLGLCCFGVGVWLEGLRAREAAGVRGVLGDSAEQGQPFVHETADHKALHFSLTEVQSRMLKRDPHALQADYTRTMMGFLALGRPPMRIAMIGLGGGSLAKFCYRELPNTRIDVVEINPHVIALRDEFHVPPDDRRFHVHLDDGARFIQHSKNRYDVLLVDAYTRDGIPAQLTTQRFYDSCRKVLGDTGILVSNLCCDDAHVHVARIQASFGGPVFSLEEPDTENLIVFACANDGPMRRAAAMVAPPYVRLGAWNLLKPTFSRVVAAFWASSDQTDPILEAATHGS